MTAEYRFYKTTKGEWYIDIPQWPEDNIAALQMVAGADEMLDIVSGFKNEVKLVIATEDKSYTYKLKYTGDASAQYGEGAFYLCTDVRDDEFRHPLWLCDVTLFIFGSFPKTIYFDVI